MISDEIGNATKRPNDYSGSAEAAFNRKLREAAKSIVAEARGKTCGGCSFYNVVSCGKMTNAEGSPLSILYPTAVACSSWKKRAAGS